MPEQACLDSPPETALGGYLVLDHATGLYRYRCCGLASPVRAVDDGKGEWSVCCDPDRFAHLLEHAVAHSEIGVSEIVSAVLSAIVRGR